MMAGLHRKWLSKGFLLLCVVNLAIRPISCCCNKVCAIECRQKKVKEHKSGKDGASCTYRRQEITGSELHQEKTQPSLSNLFFFSWLIVSP